jgi:hypothetical protein
MGRQYTAVFCAGSCSNNTFVIWPHGLQEVETALSTRTAQTHPHQQLFFLYLFIYNMLRYNVTLHALVFFYKLLSTVTTCIL